MAKRGSNPLKGIARTGFKISSIINTIGYLFSGSFSKIGAHFARKFWAKKSGRMSKKIFKW